ncbi:MAG: hypothetical protein R3B48_29495 [Kofleriaceae bacterium]
MKKTALAALLLAAVSSASASAQTQLLPTDDTLKGAEETEPQGWNPSLAGTATVNLVSNSSVVGQVDGFSTLFGLGIFGGLDFVDGPKILRTTLSINESFARTPVVDEFVKTNDVIQLEGIYNYFLSKTAGAFGRLTLQTSAFAAEDVRGEPTSWVEKGDTPRPLNQDAFRQRLAGSFAPFTLSESAGGFFEPLHKERLSLSVRLGLGGRHTFADSVLLSDDDKATPDVELVRLSNVHQLGAEAFAGATGKARDGKISYRAGLAILMPFVNNDSFDRGVGTLTRVGLESSVTFNVYDWMSLVYSLNVTRDAQLFPKGNELTQVQNSLLLTFKYSFLKKKEIAKAAEPTAAELELAAANSRAETAEKRATELEQELAAAKAATCADCAGATPAPVEPAPATPEPGPAMP